MTSTPSRYSVEIRRSGRWSWYLVPHETFTPRDGDPPIGSVMSGWIVLGSRERAARAARRWIMEQARNEADRFVVEEDA